MLLKFLHGGQPCTEWYYAGVGKIIKSDKIENRLPNVTVKISNNLWKSVVQLARIIYLYYNNEYNARRRVWMRPWLVNRNFWNGSDTNEWKNCGKKKHTI